MFSLIFSRDIYANKSTDLSKTVIFFDMCKNS